MLREALAAGVLVLVLFAPTAPALPPDCTAALVAEESIQNDADSGDDAGDMPADALRVHYDDYYWAYLSGIDHAMSDVDDWYVFAVPEDRLSVMASVIVSAPGVPSDVYVPDAAQRFHLALIAPDGSVQSVDSRGGSARFEHPAAGDYLIHISPHPSAMPVQCAGSSFDAEAPATPLARNHGLYVGCHPVCLDRPDASR